jgi:hypothetical protein
LIEGKLRLGFSIFPQKTQLVSEPKLKPQLIQIKGDENSHTSLHLRNGIEIYGQLTKMLLVFPSCE